MQSYPKYARDRCHIALKPPRYLSLKVTAWQARIPGIELGKGIHDQDRLPCTGSLTGKGQHADRRRAGFDRRPAKVLTHLLGIKPGEISALFKQALGVDRSREINEQMLATGLLV